MVSTDHTSLIETGCDQTEKRETRLAQTTLVYVRGHKGDHRPWTLRVSITKPGTPCLFR
jgi:hypothetical protein